MASYMAVPPPGRSIRTPWERASLSSVKFLQAEGGIRDWSVTGGQTCALPIYPDRAGVEVAGAHHDAAAGDQRRGPEAHLIRPEHRRDRDVAPGLQLTVDLH